MTTDITRRTALRTIGGGLTLGMTAGVVSAKGGSSTLSEELNTVREATLKYRDPATARADGYTEISPYVPGMGFHFENLSLVASDENEAPDLTKPAVILYQANGSYKPAPFSPHDSTRDDDLLMGAAEFVHDGTPGADADYFDDENAPRNVKTPESEGWAPIPGGHTGLHVWVHRGNPDGVFASFNPTVD